jgi:hypothetical protein
MDTRQLCMVLPEGRINESKLKKQKMKPEREM